MALKRMGIVENYEVVIAILINAYLHNEYIEIMISLVSTDAPLIFYVYY